MKRASIVLGYTPYHAFITEEILKEIPGETYCLFTKMWPNGNYTPLGSQAYPTLGATRKILSLHQSLKRLKKLLKTVDEISLYLPHPSHLIGNFLFFHKKTTNTYIYEDGILNYYDAKARDINSLQIAASTLLNIRYKKFQGHLSGIHAKKVQAIYLSRPEQSIFLPNHTEVQKLTFKSMENYVPDDVLLFLDQNTDQQLTPEQRSSAIATVQSIAAKHQLRIITKSHHDQAKSQSSDGSTLSPNEPAELTIRRVKPRIVASFFSSALINIKQIEPEIRCISLASRHITVDINEAPASLSHIFEGAGVECI